MGAMSGLNRASAGCFTRMTGSGRRFAHVFGERTMATLGRLMSLLSPFDVVIWMTDGWPLYESR
ncbi:TPA: IS1 family transposase, partial [Klebsiella pneumoniae]